jgi:hypothetical protein
MHDCQVLCVPPVLVGDVFDKMDAHSTILAMSCDSFSDMAAVLQFDGSTQVVGA